tara:strand:+ start:60 stop:410 length:351 start_codon:yes stop_codon:yes gene_type:complete
MITSNGLEKLGFTPNVDFVLQDDGDGVYIKEWNSASPQPPEDRIHIASLEAQAEYEAKEYQRDRQPEYPSVGDQLDAILKHLNYRRTQGEDLVKDLDNIVGAWLNVKSRYPKNGSN